MLHSIQSNHIKEPHQTEITKAEIEKVLEPYFLPFDRLPDSKALSALVAVFFPYHDNNRGVGKFKIGDDIKELSHFLMYPGELYEKCTGNWVATEKNKHLIVKFVTALIQEKIEQKKEKFVVELKNANIITDETKSVDDRSPLNGKDIKILRKLYKIAVANSLIANQIIHPSQIYEIYRYDDPRHHRSYFHYTPIRLKSIFLELANLYNTKIVDALIHEKIIKNRHEIIDFYLNHFRENQMLLQQFIAVYQKEGTRCLIRDSLLTDKDIIWDCSFDKLNLIEKLGDLYANEKTKILIAANSNEQAFIVQEIFSYSKITNMNDKIPFHQQLSLFPKKRSWMWEYEKPVIKKESIENIIANNIKLINDTVTIYDEFKNLMEQKIITLKDIFFLCHKYEYPRSCEILSNLKQTLKYNDATATSIVEGLTARRIFECYAITQFDADKTLAIIAAYRNGFKKVNLIYFKKIVNKYFCFDMNTTLRDINKGITLLNELVAIFSSNEIEFLIKNEFITLKELYKFMSRTLDGYKSSTLVSSVNGEIIKPLFALCQNEATKNLIAKDVITPSIVFEKFYRNYQKNSHENASTVIAGLNTVYLAEYTQELIKNGVITPKDIFILYQSLHNFEGCKKYRETHSVIYEDEIANVMIEVIYILKECYFSDKATVLLNEKIIDPNDIVSYFLNCQFQKENPSDMIDHLYNLYKHEKTQKLLSKKLILPDNIKSLYQQDLPVSHEANAKNMIEAQWNAYQKQKKILSFLFCAKDKNTTDKSISADVTKRHSW